MRQILNVLFIVITALGAANCKDKELVLTANLEKMVLIPAGEFTMGSDTIDKEMLQQRFGMKKIPYQNENPSHKVTIPAYYIDKYEVTNREYKEYMDVAKIKHPRYWENETYPEGLDDHPVRFVSWQNANGYCRWRGKRLPTEQEWEKAARGKEGYYFPWGNEFVEKNANMLGLHNGVKKVGSFPKDLSSYGVYDMAGNVSEWVDSWYLPYPGNKFVDPDYGQKNRVIRGGNWGGVGHYSFELFYRSTYRTYEVPHALFEELGFRCAYTPPSEKSAGTEADK